MPSSKKYRTAVFYKNYFEEFFLKQSEKVRAKIIWTIQMIEELERVPENYLKHITGTEGLYEIRVKFGSNIFVLYGLEWVNSKVHQRPWLVRHKTRLYMTILESFMFERSEFNDFVIQL